MRFCLNASYLYRKPISFAQNFHISRASVSSSNGSETSVADVVDADVCPVDVAALNVFNASETTSKGNADRDGKNCSESISNLSN